ncbi:hypothetical protein [Streptomyces sp. NPDC093225]|uniref:hypothetical protein n=1 Tax=Streptomyces sp. NPDC093225 TaxID=3366034 RepID=UPI003829A374
MKRRLAVTGTIAAGLLMLSSGNVWAATNVSVKTTDSNPGGAAVFQPDGDHVIVCDLQADGLPAVGYLRRYDGALWSTTTAGGVGTCNQRTIDIPEGQKLTLTVCLIKDGRDVFCRTANAVA